MTIKDPHNPLYGRENANGRGFTRYNYTTWDIARLTGRAIGTVRNDIAAGRLIMDDLKSVSEYIMRHSRRLDHV